ncbi:MAG TPA: protease inhibitor I42 family protein [Dehalococcoidia bacterium]|nr:protease inhibitor I42 family protein [Dehalococcoidia bacterium]
MKLRSILLFAMLATSLLLVSGCVTSHDYNEEFSCDDFEEENHRSGEFELEVHDKIRLELCSNHTAGFAWSAEIDNEDVLAEEDYDYIEPESDGILGAPGTEIWTFEAVGEGTTEVTMEYSQAGGDIQAKWTYTMTVTVEEE